MTDHPGLALLLSAGLLAALRGRWRAVVALTAPLVALALALRLEDGVHVTGELMGLPIAPLVVDSLSQLFAIVFSLAVFAGALFGINQERRLELPAAFLYAGSAIGVVLAGDLLTVFVLWEVMAIGSTLVIWSAGTRASYRASMRYLIVHLLGGVLLFAGVAGHVLATGSTEFTAMTLDGYPQVLILAAFLINAGAWPMSSWLPDAYPEASWSGMVFLSAFTTKTSVYVLIRGFPGTELLIYVGLVMVIYGIVYALLENDMRRILAYSIVNQVGFMVTGIGIGTEMALNGAAAHAFTHIIYKALLLMSAGSVLLVTGRRKCSELGGLFRTMPLTTICGIIGALAISSFPMTSGFVSKSMITQAAGDGHLFVVWMLLAAASAGVFLHAGIKYPWFVFFQKDSGLRPSEPPWNLRLAMLLLAALCIVLGLWYQPLYALLPFAVDYEPYTGTHVVAQLQLLLFSGLTFFVLLGWLKRTLTISLDVDWLYRYVCPRPVVATGALVGRAIAFVEQLGASAWRGVSGGIKKLHGPEALFAKTWASAAMGTAVMGMLLLLLLSYYFV